jgi:hypothetical protein
MKKSEKTEKKREKRKKKGKKGERERERATALRVAARKPDAVEEAE